MPKPRKLTEADLPAVKRMLSARMTDAQIGSALGCGEATLKRFRIEQGLAKPKGNPTWCRPDRQPPKPPPVVQSTYEENGRTITVLPPGIARGVVPGPTVRARAKVRIPSSR
jgi:hypothetical protein